MRTLLICALSVLVLTLCVSAPAPAGATTVGGHSSSSVGSFTLSADHIVVARASSDDPGEWVGGVPHANVDLLGFGPSANDFDSLAVDSQSGGTGLARPPLLAPAGEQTAVAWSAAAGIRSALADRLITHLTATATTAATGAVGGLAVAGDPSGARAVAWSDTAGVHLQAFAVTGAPTTGALASPAPSATARIGIARDARGGWWVLWQAGGSLAAVNVTGDGTVGSVRDLGAASASDLGHLVSDGLGGLWITMGFRIAHLTATGVQTTMSARTSLALATGDGATAIAQNLAHGGIRVRRLSTTLSGWTRLPGHGFTIDIAYDRGLGTTEVLTGHGDGQIRLTHIARNGRITWTRELGSCRGADGAQILAARGLVAIGCAGMVDEDENVETGGDYRSGRTCSYKLLRHGHVVADAETFEGDYSY